MKRKMSYKGITSQDKRPGRVPSTKTDLEDREIEPEYVKKYYKRKTPCNTVTQLKLFGNPYDMHY